MEIHAAITSSTISLASIVRATSGQGKVNFPVNSSNIVYANFKNINAVPSFNDTGSYSISRLRALDNLIEQLNRMKGRNKIEVPGLDDLNMNDQNSLISELSEEIHTKLQTALAYNLPIESSGLLFNILV